MGVLLTWREIAEYLRKSKSWARKAAKEDGLPVLISRGPRRVRKVWTTTSLIDTWLSKKILEVKYGEFE